MQNYIIIFTENKRKLTLALAWDYEYSDYQRASRKSFTVEDMDKAIEYMQELAKDNQLEIASKYSQETDFLD